MVVLAPSTTLLLLGLSLLGLLPASRGNTCNQLADERYVRCGANPLQRAGQYHSDERLYEISIGDPDVQYDAVSRQWHAWWSTGLASSYTAANQSMGIKHAVSADGVRFEPTLAPVLRTAASPTAWDHSKAETPTVVRLPPAIRTPERQWLMLYSGGNDGAPRPAGITYTWYQIGAAFSADGESFTKISAAESPYAGKATPYSGSIEGLVLLGRDAFPGVAGVADGLVADPELVVDPDGTTLHLFFSSEAIDSRGTPLKYGVSHATSQDGVHWVVSPGNPVRATPPLFWATRTPLIPRTQAINGGSGPSVVRGTSAGFQLFFLQDSAQDKAKIPTTFNPELGVWAANASSLAGPWRRSGSGQGLGGREVSWDASVPTEGPGWIATGDMAWNAPGGERRWYYVAFDVTPPILSGWVAPVHPSLRNPLGLEPAMIALSMMHRGAA